MPTFSSKSKKHLLTCDVHLQALFREVIKKYDCTILQGNRSKKEQDEYYRTGRSKVKYPNSKHNTNPSEAVDVAPYPIDWNDYYRFYHFGGYVKGVADQLGVKVRWGGDWDSDTDFNDQTFNDLVHWELVGK